MSMYVAQNTRHSAALPHRIDGQIHAGADRINSAPSTDTTAKARSGGIAWRLTAATAGC